MQQQYIDENILIRKQREEIVLLTNELNNQEAQLNHLNNENLKLKKSLKSYEKKFSHFDHEIKELKLAVDTRDKEIESIRIKLNSKESYFNKQSLKHKQSEFTVEKLNQELSTNLESIKELKTENSRLQLKINEQTNRFKLKQDELIKALNKKNDLLEIAKNQIKILETNLNNFCQLFTMLKSTDRNKNDEYSTTADASKTEKFETEMKFELNDDESNKLLIDNDPIYLINLLKKILTNSHDNQLNVLLHSLKERWFETNVICEQIKSILSIKYTNLNDDFQSSHQMLNHDIEKSNNDLLTSTPCATPIRRNRD